MRLPSLLSLPVALVAVASCSSSGTAPAPASAPAPAPATAQAAPSGARAGQAAGVAAQAGGGDEETGGSGGRGGGGGRGPALSAEQRQARADSIAAVRTAMVNELKAKYADKENQPAGEVFKNVQLMKETPVGEFLTAMDQGLGRGTGHSCTDCHIANDWASDSLRRKQTARTMMGIVHDINTSLLPRLGPGRGGQPRAISCITCHRGGAAGRNVTIP